MTAVPVRRVFLPAGDAGVAVGADTADACARMATADVFTLCRYFVPRIVNSVTPPITVNDKEQRAGREDTFSIFHRLAKIA
jgi:hypothetical protein